MRVLLSILVVLAVAGCSKGGGEKTSDDSATIGDTVAPTDGYTGEFVGEKDGYAPNRANCVEDTFDPRLTPGMKFTRDEKWSATNGRFVGWGKNEVMIKAIGEQSLVTFLTIPSVPDGWLSQRCSFSSSGSGPNRTTSTRCEILEMSTSLRSLSKGSGGRVSEKSCYVKYDGNMKSTTVAKEGTYTFSSGKKVRAYLTITTDEGSLVCDFNGPVVGRGTSIRKRIVTNDVPEYRYRTCAPTEIFAFSEARDENGNLVSAKRAELHGGNF